MKNLTKVFLIAFCAFANFLNLNGQNTVYTDLFTSSNFIKTINTTLPVGTIGGEASVSNGVATYSIPLVFPIGTNGVNPSISLVYNSGGASTCFGRGWSLAGLSTITRSSRNIYFDEIANPIECNANDKFSLDGMRLIGKTGIYGAPNSTYGPEMENFSAVTSFGGTTGNPDWWEVFSKEGIKYEYGNSTDSKFMNFDNTKILFWRLNKIKYNDGNYIEFKYLNTDGDSRIDEINYTGNSIANQLPYNKIKFNYSIRFDVNSNYEVGTKLTNKYLVDNITITAENQVFKTYSFKYGRNSNPNLQLHSFLKEIIETGADGTSLNSTIIKYGDQPTGFSVDPLIDFPSGQDRDIYPGDYNGDGFSDLLVANRNLSTGKHIGYTSYIRDNTTNNNKIGASIYTPLPEGSVVFEGNGVTDSYNFLSGDYSGDGQNDIIIYQVGINTNLIENIQLRKSIDGLTFLSPTYLSWPNLYGKIGDCGNLMFSGDFNGDGIMDLLLMLKKLDNTNNAVFLYFGNGANGFNYVSLNAPFNKNLSDWQCASKLRVLDFNGDGKSDLLVDNEIFTFNNFVARKISDLSIQVFYDDLIFIGDFNGDRKSDLLTREDENNNDAQWNVYMSDGINVIKTNYTFSHKPLINASYRGDQLQISDFNGDGLMDIFHGWNENTASKIDIYYSKGETFVKVQNAHSNNLSDYQASSSTDLDGDGRSDFLDLGTYNSNYNVLHFGRKGKELIIDKIKNGHDHQVTWTFKRMTEPSVYIRGPITVHPLNNVQFPIHLVTEINTNDGIGGNTTMQYNYESAKLHKEGKGILGFTKITNKNITSGFHTVFEYEFNTQFYTPYLNKTSIYKTSTNTLINQTTNAFDFIDQGNKRYWSRIYTVNENKAFEGFNVLTTNIYDTYGNITQMITNINNGLEITNTTVNQFLTKGTPVPSKPEIITVQKQRTGQTNFSNSTAFTYDNLGRITFKLENYSTSKQLEYSYNYLNSPLGTLKEVGVTALFSGNTRYTKFTYDIKGRFIIATEDPELYTTAASFDSRWGKPIWTKGVDGLFTYYNYDGFGRLISTSPPAATSYNITETYGWDINNTEKTVHFHKTLHPGKPDVKVYYDLLNREVKREIEGFQNFTILQKTTYDSKGNVATSTSPFKSNEVALLSTNTYDEHNRIISINNALGTNTLAYSYSGGQLTTTSTNSAGQVSTKVIDPSGKVITATDYGGTLTYEYYAHGKLKKVLRTGVTLNEMEYDIVGNQTKLIDINAGITLYNYNEYGELTSQTNAKGEIHNFTYDKLSRIKTKTYPDNGVTTTTTYEYFPANNGTSTEKIKKITAFSGTVEEFTYDAYSRLSSKKVTIDNILHTTFFSYNNYNDQINLIYPSGFGINYVYDANGYLLNIKNQNNTLTLFTNQEMNGFNQYKQYTLGNGKTSNNTYYYNIPTRYYTAGIQDLNLNWNYTSGNLNSRYDAIKNKTESFTYDNLNRLLSSSGAGLTTLTQTYNLNGNLETKTDVGSYVYNNSKINAVTKVSNTQNNIPVYLQDISYSSFFQPTLISEYNSFLSYTYGADEQRIKSVLQQGTTIINSKYYFGSYEKDITSNITKHIHYINDGENLIAIVVRENGNDNYYYSYTDHLGSILTLTNNTGVKIAEQNFDAWGRSRHPDNWSYSSIPTPPVWLYRGFTGHEDLAKFKLINMNGRLYDPIVSRMLSPDNNIQADGYTQNYNRFTYSLNNPLRYTDPDGEFIHIVAGALIGGIINVATHLHKIQNTTDALAAFGIGAAAGAAVALTGGVAAGAFSATATTASAIILNGAISGGIGALVGSPLQGIGNAIYFQDEYSVDQYYKDILYGITFGAAFSALTLLPKYLSKNPSIEVVGTKWDQNNYEESVKTFGAKSKKEAIQALEKAGYTTIDKASESNIVFRAVDKTEAAIIKSSGQFSLSEGGVEVKYFAKSFEDAQWYGQRLYPNGYSIIQAQVIAPVKAAQYWFPHIDIGAYVFPKETLPYIIPR